MKVMWSSYSKNGSNVHISIYRSSQLATMLHYHIAKEAGMDNPALVMAQFVIQGTLVSWNKPISFYFKISPLHTPTPIVCLQFASVMEAQTRRRAAHRTCG